MRPITRGSAGLTQLGRAGAIATLTPAESADLLPSGSPAPRGCAAAVVDEVTTAYLYFKGALDPAKELAKLSSQQVCQSAGPASFAVLTD